MKSFFKFLGRNKFYTLVNVLGLSVSLMFVLIASTYIWQETQRDRQHAKADRIYALGIGANPGDGVGSAWALQYRLRDRFPEIESSCAITAGDNAFKDEAGNLIKGESLMVDSTFFSMFDFPLKVGDRATVLSSPNAVVITEEFARRMFPGRDPMGRSFRIRSDQDSTTLVVTGIMEPITNSVIGSGLQEPIAIVARIEMMKYINPYILSPRMNNATGAGVFLLARPGVDLSSRVADYTEYARDFYWILEDPDRSLCLTPLRELYFNRADYLPAHFGQSNPTLIRLLGAAGLVILIFAIINYINLTVAQSAKRAREMSMRCLLGDSRKGIVWRLIAESSLLVLVSAAIGLLLAVAVRPIASELLRTNLDLAILLQPMLVLLAIVAFALTGITAGIIPAAVISAAKPIDVVRGTFHPGGHHMFTKVFIVVQNVVTIVMLSCALTMYLQLRHLVNAPMGFDYSNVISFSAIGMDQTLKERISALPMVEAVSLSQGTPLDGGNNWTFHYGSNSISLQIFEVDPEWLDIYRISTMSDNGAHGAYVTRRFLAEEGLDETSPNILIGENVSTVRGIIQDFKIRGILAEQHPMAVMVQPQIENPWNVSVRVTGDHAAAWDAICRVYTELNNGMDLRDFESDPFEEQKIRRLYAEEERLLTLVAIFTAIAVLLSALGLMAMSTYYVQERAKEIAVRKVFGSTSAAMTVRLLRSFGSYVAIAVVIAVPVAYCIMGDWLSSYTYRISLSWWIFAIASIFCALVALIAVLAQSRRAANTNPIHYLRNH